MALIVNDKPNPNKVFYNSMPVNRVYWNNKLIWPDDLGIWYKFTKHDCNDKTFLKKHRAYELHLSREQADPDYKLWEVKDGPVPPWSKRNPVVVDAFGDEYDNPLTTVCRVVFETVIAPTKILDASYGWFIGMYNPHLTTIAHSEDRLLDFTWVNPENLMIDYQSQITNIFYQCFVPYYDLSTWVTGDVTNMKYMFSENNAVKNIYVGGGWSVSNVSIENSKGMFYNCVSLHNMIREREHSEDKTYAIIDDGKNGGYLSKRQIAPVILNVPANMTIDEAAALFSVYGNVKKVELFEPLGEYNKVKETYWNGYIIDGSKQMFITIDRNIENNFIIYYYGVVPYELNIEQQYDFALEKLDLVATSGEYRWPWDYNWYLDGVQLPDTYRKVTIPLLDVTQELKCELFDPFLSKVVQSETIIVHEKITDLGVDVTISEYDLDTKVAKVHAEVIPNDLQANKFRYYVDNEFRLESESGDVALDKVEDGAEIKVEAEVKNSSPVSNTTILVDKVSFVVDARLTLQEANDLFSNFGVVVNEPIESLDYPANTVAYIRIGDSEVDVRGKLITLHNYQEYTTKVGYFVTPTVTIDLTTEYNGDHSKVKVKAKLIPEYADPDHIRWYVNNILFSEGYASTLIPLVSKQQVVKCVFENSLGILATTSIPIDKK